MCTPCDDDDSIIRPRLFPSPKPQSAAQIELHNATHLPYRNWCPWCVAGRRNNTQHRELSGKRARTEPCLHLDYALLSDEIGTEALTVLIGKLELSGAPLTEQSSTFACPLTEKDTSDLFAHNQLKTFVKLHGVKHMISKAIKRERLWPPLRKWLMTSEEKATL